MVSAAWARPIKHGKANNAASTLCRKLKMVRQALSRWSKNISRLSISIQNTNKAILKLDTIEDKRYLTVPESNYRKILKTHLL